MEINEVVCRKCGITIVLPANKRKQNTYYCFSCRVRPAKTVRYGDEVCIPWPFDFNYQDQPMKDGVVYLPGKRTCNHADCVNPLHILSEA